MIVETYSVDKILLERLKSENEQLRSIIDINQKESLVYIIIKILNNYTVNPF